MKNLLTLFLFWILSNLMIAQGHRINIPADQPTIQAGIDAAADGDTVLVADGTYFENINFKGKAIVVASHFLVDGDETHVDSTVINGSQPNPVNIGTVVRLMSGEDSSSVLYGFTITGGTGMMAPDGSAKAGGGIIVEYSGGKIQYNRIVHNVVIGAHPFAAGIFVHYPNNQVIISNNQISYNTVTSTMYSNLAGGVFIRYDNGKHVNFHENIVSYNSVTGNGNGCGGGGISLWHSSSIIRNNIIKNNSAQRGGGIDIVAYENIPNAQPTIINNTVVSNRAKDFGGGIMGQYDITPQIPLRNNIIWGNSATDDPQVSRGQPYDVIGTYDVVVEYSDVEGGFNGTGNIDSNPLFADTMNYYLLPTSPCIDAGNPDPIYNDKDGTRNDIGASGGPLVITRIDENLQRGAKQADNFVLQQNYPNPFNPYTTIKYSIPSDMKGETGNVKLVVYDALGEEIATLVNEKQSPGNYEVEFDAKRLTSGIYFYKLIAGSLSQTKKMILIK